MTVKTMTLVDGEELSAEKGSGEENSNGATTNTAEFNGCIEGRKRVGIIELGDVTPHNIKLLRRLNQVIFPVSYNAKFYKDVLELGSLARLAYYNDVMVGAVCCRVDTTDPASRRLYIMTLGCLASYRRLGIGTVMVEHVLDYVKSKDPNFDSIFLHVQVNNQDAIEFYKRFGFEIIETRKNYYKRIEPPDAHVLSKCLKKNN